MLDSNQLNKAFRARDPASVRGVVGAQGLADLGDAQKFVTVLRRSGSLAIQIHDPAVEAARDQLVQECRTLLATCPEAAVLQDFENHVADAQIVERGYREIFATMRQSEICKLAPQRQAWAVVARGEGEFAHIAGELDKELEKAAAGGNRALDPRQIQLPAGPNGSVSPDAVIHAITRNVGDTLIALAHQHRWFQPTTGALIMPPVTPSDETIIFQAGTFSLVASQWRRLENAWDRSRLLGARLRLRQDQVTDAKGESRDVTVLEVQPPDRRELMDRIALERLQQVFFQTQMDIAPPGLTPDNPGQPTGPLPLLPVAHLCPDERVTATVLESNYCIPIEDDKLVVGGIPLKVWLRGYSYYLTKAHGPNGDALLSGIHLSELELLDGLKLAGLSDNQAKTFISLTTFGRGSADLFDTPLLSVSDGSYYLFAPAYQSAVLGNILLSRISSLNPELLT